MAPTVSVVNTRDGIGPRAPIFAVQGRDEKGKSNLNKLQPMVTVSNIENNGVCGIELTNNKAYYAGNPNDPDDDRKIGWTIFTDEPTEELKLRKLKKSGNWRLAYFLELEGKEVLLADGVSTAVVHVFTSFCPLTRSAPFVPAVELGPKECVPACWNLGFEAESNCQQLCDGKSNSVCVQELAGIF